MDVEFLFRSSVIFSWCFPEYWSSQALLQIKMTPLWHQIFLSVAASFHAHLLFLYFWNCNDYAVVGRATFNLAEPHSGSIQTYVSTFISGNLNPEEIWSMTHPDSVDTCASWSKTERNSQNEKSTMKTDYGLILRNSIQVCEKVDFLQAPLQLPLDSMQGQ